MKTISIIFLGALIVSIISPTSQAADRQWFVAVYGENFEPVVGASADEDVTEGEFLSDDFVGKVMYVKIEKDYSLIQYYSAPVTDIASGSASMSTSDASVANSPQDTGPIGEYGPLVDTGLQYVLDGGFYGWECSHLFVTHLGGQVHRLRCDETMRHNG